MKKANMITGLIVLALALGVIGYTYSTFPSSVKGVPGPGVFPILVAVIMLVCAVIVLVDALRMSGEEGLALLEKGNIRVYIMIGILAAYILLMQVIGFVVVTFLFLTGIIRWFSGKKILYCVAWGLGLSLLVYSAFTYLLKVSLNFGLLI